MGFRLPPLSAVRVFEAAGRTLSFKAAAEELHVTPSAVSHGVQALEAWLGQELFVRRQKALSLTAAGQRFLVPVQQALERLASATISIPGTKAAGRLTVSVPATFGSRWLIPRLPRFAERYPEITVTIDTERRQVDLSQASVDLAIRMASAPRAGGTWLRLFREAFVPVCAPTVRARFGDLELGELLRVVPLLHVTSVTEDWSSWFRERGIEPRKGSGRDLRFDTIRMAIDAAVQGLGIALGRKPLVDEEIFAKRLVEVGPSQQARTCYWLVGEVATFKRAEARLFRRWLLDELQAATDSGLAERTIERSSAR